MIGIIYNKVFHCSTPESQDIAADATNRYQVCVSRWNIVPQLSQESFELEQICQWLECAPWWEEQSINRLFHCSMPGSKDKVAVEQFVTEYTKPVGTLYLIYLKNHLS